MPKYEIVDKNYIFGFEGDCCVQDRLLIIQIWIIFEQKNFTQKKFKASLCYNRKYVRAKVCFKWKFY